MSLLACEPRTALYRTTEPSEPPVSLQQAKDRVGIGDDTSVDDELLTLILAATKIVEDATARAFISQSWEFDLDYFPEVIELRRIPVQTGTVVVKYVTGGTLTTFSSSSYEVDIVSTPPRLVPVDGVAWPATDYTLRAVRVTFDAGYTSTYLVPALAKQAILEAVDSLYRGCDLSMAYYSLIKALNWGGYR